jgi:glutathione S-transferase
MRSIGAAPTGEKPDGSPLYTLPAIVDPSRTTSSGGPTVVSESFRIAEYLDEAYPTPSTGALFPPGTKALQQLFYEYFFKNIMMLIITMALPEMFKHLNEGSRP